jgi:hypothetical protein
MRRNQLFKTNTHPLTRRKLLAGHVHTFLPNVDECMDILGVSL